MEGNNFKSVGATEMNKRHTRMNIGSQVRAVSRSTSLSAFLPIALFAALVAAIALMG
jgi:hypothetical protein